VGIVAEPTGYGNWVAVTTSIAFVLSFFVLS